jgi:hypothetical protein
MNTQNNERGQAIVIIAFAFIVLMAFAALAIDGGMVYSDRRHAQNASDAGSLAGAGAASLILENEYVEYADFDCGATAVQDAMSAAEVAASNLMQANGYGPADFTVTTECEDYEDPDLDFEEKYIDVITEIITQTRTAMIHVVYGGTVQNRVSTTTRLQPPPIFAFGHAVVGLNPGDGSCSANVDGVKIGGDGDFMIVGGGIWSQGCLSTGGDCSIAVTDPNGNVLPGGISYGGGSHGTCNDGISPDPGFQDEILPETAYQVPEPDCSAPGAVSITSITSSIDLNTAYPNKTLICLTSSGNAIKLTGSPTFTGSGYTIYLPNNGDIEIGANAVVDLEAPGDEPTPAGGITGVLFYIPGEALIKITGTSEQNYFGMIYAPSSDIEITGSSDIGPTLNTQIIGWNVSLLGNARVNINYDKTWNFQIPTYLDLEK